MEPSLRLLANGSVPVMRKAYKPIGFAKGYNFALWFVFVGACVGLAPVRSAAIRVRCVLCGRTPGSTVGAVDGECWYYLYGVS